LISDMYSTGGGKMPAATNPIFACRSFALSSVSGQSYNGGYFFGYKPLSLPFLTVGDDVFVDIGTDKLPQTTMRGLVIG